MELITVSLFFHSQYYIRDFKETSTPHMVSPLPDYDVRLFLWPELRGIHWSLVVARPQIVDTLLTCDNVQAPCLTADCRAGRGLTGTGWEHTLCPHQARPSRALLQCYLLLSLLAPSSHRSHHCLGNSPAARIFRQTLSCVMCLRGARMIDYSSIIA